MLKVEFCSLPTKCCYHFPEKLPITLGGINLILMYALKIDQINCTLQGPVFLVLIMSCM